MKVFTQPRKNTNSRYFYVLLLCVLGALADSQPARANYLSTTTIEASGQDWTTAIWQTNSTPGNASGQSGTAVGANATTGPGNSFEILSNGVAITSGSASVTVPAVRTPGSASTFSGLSLAVDTNTVLKFKTAGPTTFTNLILKGGVLSDGGVNQIATVSGGVQIISQSYISSANDADADGPGINSGAAFIFNAALSGSGNFYLMNSANGATNIISGGSKNTFSGQWIIQNGMLRGDNAGSLGTNSITIDPSNTLYQADMPLITPAVGGAGSAAFDVSYDLNSAGTLTLTNGGKMNLRQHCAFAAVNIAGTALSSGTHHYSELTNNFPGSFFSGGSDATGTITVQSYSSTWTYAPPAITSQPQSVSTTTGQTVSFTVTAINGTLSYQWYTTNNNVLTPLTDTGDHFGSTTATLTFTNAAMSDSGNYVVIASNSSGSITSSVATLTVYDPSNLPAIMNLYPNGTNLYQPSSTLSFTAASPSAGINASGIQVVLNGINYSNRLVIGGSSLSRTVSCLIRPNQYYVAAITVADVNGLQTSQTFRFDTFSPVLSFEAEDYDYGGGQFITNGIDQYAGLAGTEGVDMHVTTADAPASAYIYRGTSQMACSPFTDVPRLAYGTNQDYTVGYFHVSEWMNFTRPVPSGSYNVYARVASGNSSASISFGLVTNGIGTSSQTVQALGAFSFGGRGWSSFDFVPLQQNGSLVTVNLSGTNTFQATSTAEANVSFFILVPAATDLPHIAGVYPDGSVLFQPTNRMVFTASNSVFGINQTNITVSLNGANVTSSLSFSGSTNAWSVSLPLALSTNYHAVIVAVDNYGNVVSNAFYFDTFSPNNFTFEAEDFDFNGGQYIDNPGIDAYANEVSTPYVDEWYVNQVGGAPFVYRPSDWISTAVSTDVPRQNYLNASATDYQVGYWLGGSWINYTHTYPAGTYTIWARLAGASTYHVQLTNTIAGVSTNYLGTFSASGRGWVTYDWVPLKDTNGQIAAVTLGGVSTLTTATDGNANANFFMLVATNPAYTAPNPVMMSALLGAGQTNLVFSFPTQSGYNYQLLYKTNLTDPTWLPLNSVPGNGTTESVTNAITGGSRFFRLLIQ